MLEVSCIIEPEISGKISVKVENMIFIESEKDIFIRPISELISGKRIKFSIRLCVVIDYVVFEINFSFFSSLQA